MNVIDALCNLFGLSSPVDVVVDETAAFKQSIIAFLEHETRLFELIGDATDISSCFSLIKGCVQSGKSRIIHALCLYCTCVLEKNIVVVVRNFTDDYDQFRRGFERFLTEFVVFLNDDIGNTDDLPGIYYIGDIRRSKDKQLLYHEDMIQDMISSPSVLIALANHDQLSKLNDCLDMLDGDANLSVVIDEIDQIGYSMGDRFDPQLRHLVEHHTDAVIGISATLFEPLQTSKFGFHSDNVYYLTPPPAYKGVVDINFHSIEKTKGDLLNDPDLVKYLDQHRGHKPFDIKEGQKHPMITLLKTEHVITQQDLLLDTISEKFSSEYTVITYNGTRCRLSSDELKDPKKIVLPVCKKKSVSKDGTHVFKNTPLPYVLQYLKDNGGADRFPRIVIIAYKLVGRGINVVSEDFGWHLTHLFYRPSSTTDVTSLLQSMRLCGIYQDSIPLHCYMPQADYESLYRGYMLQEDLLSRLTASTATDPLSEFVKETKVFTEKIPKRGLYRNVRYRGGVTKEASEDTGMTMEEFNRRRCVVKMLSFEAAAAAAAGEMDEKEYQRLTNGKNGMFKKWADVTNQSAIARFMREGLDPHREYTKKEMTDLCNEYGIQISHITGIRKKSQTHGQIMIKKNKKHRLHPELIKSFEKYF